MSFEVFTAVKISMLVFWVVTPCGFVGRYKRFGGIYCIHLQGLRPTSTKIIHPFPSGLLSSLVHQHGVYTLGQGSKTCDPRPACGARNLFYAARHTIWELAHARRAKIFLY
jgi:hypothetical protein